MLATDPSDFGTASGSICLAERATPTRRHAKRLDLGGHPADWEAKMSLKRICAVISRNPSILRRFASHQSPITSRRSASACYLAFSLGLVLLFGGCAHVGPKVAAKGGFTTVVLDPGHGGKDNGGTSRRRSNPFQLEKNLTLDTAKRVRDLLRRSGFRVVMMRDGDYFVELDDRVARANKEGNKAILVSIHYNATGNSSANGAEVYFWRADSHGLATRIESNLVRATGEQYGGVIRRRLRLTRNPEIRCVLCECAYLTNPQENTRVADSSARQRIAQGIATGILEQARLGDDGIPPVPEIWAPMSRAEDARSSRHVSRRHRSKK
jgi:N-acetylmuramoyl-L-alanine amidase